MSTARHGDVEIAYETLGTGGEPLIIALGVGVPLTMLPEGLGAELVGRGFHVALFDNRDTGLSTHFTDAPKPSVWKLLTQPGSGAAYTLDDMADDAVAVLDEAGVDSAHVVGASMGGAISQILAVKYPERLRSLTLACTSGRNHPWREELLASWRDAALEQGIGAMGREAARWVIGPRSFRRLLPAIGWLGPLALGRPAHAFAAQCDAILAVGDVSQDLVDRLPEIAVPTLVLVGNQDILTPRGDSEDLVATIPTAELVVISGAAHGFMVEHATTFNRVLLEFLGRAERAFQSRSSPAERDDALAG